MCTTPVPARRLLRAVAAAASLCAAGAGNAALIDFSDIPWRPAGDGSFHDQPIAVDHYAALGVLIDTGYLQGGQDGPASQFMLGGNGLQIRFTGTLPRFVGLTFSSPLEDAGAWVDAQGPGYTATVDTGGYLGGRPGDEPPAPPRRNVYASFSSPGGISTLSFDNAYSHRIAAAVDNLYFGAVPPVPEPASGVLLGLGAAGLWAWRRRHASTGMGKGTKTTAP